MIHPGCKRLAPSLAEVLTIVIQECRAKMQVGHSLHYDPNSCPEHPTCSNCPTCPECPNSVLTAPTCPEYSNSPIESGRPNSSTFPEHPNCPTCPELPASAPRPNHHKKCLNSPTCPECVPTSPTLPTSSEYSLIRLIQQHCCQ